MSDQDLNDIRERLTKLETAWEEHGKSSLDFRNDIKTMLKISQENTNRILEILNGNGKMGICGKVQMLWER